jgi:uncharacterized RDD family membrane protein YckC
MNEVQPPANYAGCMSRLIAFTLDLILISLVTFLFATFLGLVVEFFGLDTAVTDQVGGRLLASLQQLILLVSTCFSSLFGLTYFLFFWVMTGFTPGKGLLGLRIVRTDGRPVKLGAALLRLAGYLLSALGLFVGFVWIMVDRRRQGWHDKLARTVVIYDWRSKSS